MASRYCEIRFSDFSGLMAEMGFRQVQIEGTLEYVFERPFSDPRFDVRIYSSIDVRTNSTRECGADAIRVSLYDTLLGRYSYKGTVHRTANAKINTRERARDAWRWARDNRCQCGAMMAERKGSMGKFLGCTDYPNLQKH